MRPGRPQQAQQTRVPDQQKTMLAAAVDRKEGRGKTEKGVHQENKDRVLNLFTDNIGRDFGEIVLAKNRHRINGRKERQARPPFIPCEFRSFQRDHGLKQTEGQTECRDSQRGDHGQHGEFKNHR